MKIAYVKGGSTTFVFTNEEIAIAFGIICRITKECGGKTREDLLRLHAISMDMEMEINRRAQQQADADRYHLCAKCFKEIDTKAHEYHHSVFPSGDSIWFHKECPPTNTGEGYES